MKCIHTFISISFLVTDSKHLMRSNLQEKGFLLAHSYSEGSMEEGGHGTTCYTSTDQEVETAETEQEIRSSHIQ